jgi:hypothetical protein
VSSPSRLVPLARLQLPLLDPQVAREVTIVVDLADEAGMANRSIRYLLRKKSPEKKTSSPEKQTLSPEMRNLLGSWRSTATVIRKTRPGHR